MKIGIISDTHRNKIYVDQVVDWLITKQRIAMLYHLGDDWEDVADLADRYIDIVQVPGIYDPRYHDGIQPVSAMETVQGINILLVHSLEKDITTTDKTRSDIICNGHTHKAELRFSDMVLYMNPGHLKGPLDKNMPPSFGMLEIQDKHVIASIIDLSFKTTETIAMGHSDRGLYRE